MKKTSLLLTAACLITLGGSQFVVAAPGKGKGKGKAKGKSTAPARGKSLQPKGKKKEVAPSLKPLLPGQAKKSFGKTRPDGDRQEWRSEGGFQDRDRRAFQTHFEQYKRHPHGLPPGLAKNLQRGKPLPPGWQKKLAEGWVIDDTHWGHFIPVPPAYLPPTLSHPRDTGVYLIGDRLVRVHRPRRQVIDVVQVASILANR